MGGIDFQGSQYIQWNQFDAHTDAEAEAEARCGYTLILWKFLTDKRTDRKKLKVFQIILIALFFSLSEKQRDKC